MAPRLTLLVLLATQNVAWCRRNDQSVHEDTETLTQISDTATSDAALEASAYFGGGKAMAKWMHNDDNRNVQPHEGALVETVSESDAPHKVTKNDYELGSQQGALAPRLKERRHGTWWASVCGIKIKIRQTSDYPLMFKDELTYRKQLVVENGNNEVCIQVALNQETGDAYIGIEAHTGCPKCPDLSTGASIMTFSELIARDFGATQMSLHDSSFLECKTNAKSGTSLPVFRLLTKGATWYQSKGYNFDEGFDSAAELFQCVPAVCEGRLQWDVLKNVGAMEIPASWPTRSSLNTLMTEAAKDNDPGALKSIGGFLSWLWTNHCDAYERHVKALSVPGHKDLSLVYVQGPGRVDDAPYVWGTVKTGMHKPLGREGN